MEGAIKGGTLKGKEVPVTTKRIIGPKTCCGQIGPRDGAKRKTGRN